MVRGIKFRRKTLALEGKPGTPPAVVRVVPLKLTVPDTTDALIAFAPASSARLGVVSEVITVAFPAGNTASNVHNARAVHEREPSSRIAKV